MFRRLLTVTAATALGVTMLTAAPAQATTADWVGPVTVESLTPTHADIAYACTGTVTYVSVSVSAGTSGVADGWSSDAPACSGEVQVHRVPLRSTSWNGDATATQLPVGSPATAAVTVEAGYDEFGGAGVVGSSSEVGTTVVAGPTKQVRDLRLASSRTVAVWANKGAPFADVSFRCDKGLQVTASVGYVAFAGGSTWSMPATPATCTGQWQKARAALVPLNTATTLPRKGETVRAEYPAVETSHLSAFLMGGSVTAF